MDDNAQALLKKPRYHWPWFLAGAVMLAVALATYAVRKEAGRVKQEQQYRIPTSEK